MTADTPRTDDQFVDANKMVPTACCNSAPEKRLADGIRYWDCSKCGETIWIENPVKDHFRNVTKLVPTLQPCPFCGATEDDSEIIEPTTDCVEPSLALHTWEHGDNHRTYLVQCARCECNGPPSHDYKEALNLWNTRK